MHLADMAVTEATGEQAEQAEAEAEVLLVSMPGAGRASLRMEP